MYDAAAGPKARDFAPKTDPLAGKTVLITGGTGSFGKRFVKTVLTRAASGELLSIPAQSEGEDIVFVRLN